MPDVTALPVALHGCRVIPLRRGTKTPDVKHATYDAASPWDASVDAFLADGGRVGVMMGGQLVGFDCDKKLIAEDGDDGSVVMVPKDGLTEVAWLLAQAQLTALPRTLRVRTQGGGTHIIFRQNPACPVTQRSIGCLDIRAHRNAYLAIGQGYEVIDDAAELAVLPEAVARVVMQVPHTPVNGKGAAQGLGNGDTRDYPRMETAFNNALLSLKGFAVKLGWPEDQATEAARRLNEVSDDPISDDRFNTTVGKDKGYVPGEMVTDDLMEWARQQTGIAEGDPEEKFLDPQTVKRIWTTERYRQYQDLQALEPPARERLADVIAEQPPQWVINNLLTAGLYGLAGPQEAGKSLLVRDWLNAVANGTTWQGYRVARPRSVSYVISEGHFDLDQRFAGIQMDNIWIFRQPVMLSNETAVDYFLRQHDGTDTGLVVFDIIYHMGVIDDNTMKDVKPVLAAGRRIAQALDCTVLVVGHPGHNTGRRFRGSSIWRNWFDGEFHMADGQITCEKHKYARKEAMEWEYDIGDWPDLSYLGMHAVLARESRNARIREEVTANPGESARSIAARLAPVLDITPERIRQVIRQISR